MATSHTKVAGQKTGIPYCVFAPAVRANHKRIPPQQQYRNEVMRKMKMKRFVGYWLVFCALTALGILPCRARFVEVVAEGKASGEASNAREQALTDALREAVRIGVGVDVLSETQVRDFVLDYDRVFAAAFGYVKGYAVLGSDLGADGIYRVRIRAQVGPGQPGMKDVLALQLLNRLKGSPRVALEVDELIEGVPAGSNYAKTWFEEAARQMQLQLVDITRMTRQSDRLAARDAFIGDQRAADYRRTGIAQMSDFVIQVRVRGRHLGRELLYGLPTQRFSFAVDLRAVLPDSGEVVAALPMQGMELGSGFESAEVAARDILHRILAGEKRNEFACGWAIFRRILARWITELDLGTIARLELKQISDAEFSQLQKALAETEKIAGVWPREFDSQGLSFLDVETRLDPAGLKDAVLKTLPGGWDCTSYTKHYLQFARARTQAKAQPAAGRSQRIEPSPSPPGGAELLPHATQQAGSRKPAEKTENQKTGITPPPRWLWVAVPMAAAVAIWVGYLVGKRAARK